jgi:uncharacterized protein (TIGR03086 family)
MRPDLTPATEMLAQVVADIGDHQLVAPTPCGKATVADLLDHVDGFCLAFTAAAAKDLDGGSRGPSANGSRLAAGWRTRIPIRLARLAAAWNDDMAWSGMTRAGGVDLPGEIGGKVALDEVIVHGWDIAVATGHDYACATGPLQAALEFVRLAVARDPNGSPGLFGPPVSVPDSAPQLDRLLGLTGRDPAWRPANKD